jgi:hypothetical protein
MIYCSWNELSWGFATPALGFRCAVILGSPRELGTPVQDLAESFALSYINVDKTLKTLCQAIYIRCMVQNTNALQAFSLELVSTAGVAVVVFLSPRF